MEALWEEARIGKPEWRSVELDRKRADVCTRLKEYATEERERLEKEKGKKGEWETGWGINRKMEAQNTGKAEGTRVENIDPIGG